MTEYLGKDRRSPLDRRCQSQLSELIRSNRNFLTTKISQATTRTDLIKLPLECVENQGQLDDLSLRAEKILSIKKKNGKIRVSHDGIMDYFPWSKKL